MTASILFEERLEIPLDIGSLAEFRRWALSDDFPDQGRIDFLQGRIELDMSPEDLYTHGKAKTTLVAVLERRVTEGDLGDLFVDRTRVSCPEADCSSEPDLVLVSNESLDRGRVRLVPKSTGEPDRYVELEGPPDLIVEIVSDASVGKDTQRLPEAYYRAGVSEMWLIDARGPRLVFQILRPGPGRFEPSPVDAEGFQLSRVLGRRYRLERSRNRHGRLQYTLHEAQPSGETP